MHPLTNLKCTNDIKTAAGEGDIFGEGCVQELFKTDVDREPRKHQKTAIATTDCTLKFLTLADLDEICNDYPSARKQFGELAASYEHRWKTKVQSARQKLRMINVLKGGSGGGAGGAVTNAAPTKLPNSLNVEAVPELEEEAAGLAAASAATTGGSSEIGLQDQVLDSLPGKVDEDRLPAKVVEAQHQPQPPRLRRSSNAATSGRQGQPESRGGGGDGPSNAQILGAIEALSAQVSRQADELSVISWKLEQLGGGETANAVAAAP